MEEILRLRPAHDETYCECILRDIVQPWYQSVGKSGAALFNKFTIEVGRLKRKLGKERTPKSVQKSNSGPQRPKSGLSREVREVRNLPDNPKRSTGPVSDPLKDRKKQELKRLCEKLEKENHMLDEQTVELSEQLSTAVAEIRSLKSHIRETSKQKNALGKGRGVSSDPHAEVSHLRSRCRELETDNTTLNETVAEQTIELQHFVDKIQRLQDHLNNLKDENNNLLNRLSKIAGDRLREGNPNIADLSDPNRPTELGKRFSELYDNEWSDAFEEMTLFKDDERRIRTLYAIMEDAFKYCERVMKDQLSEIRNILEAYPPDGNAHGGGNGIDSNSKRTSNLRKMMKDVRKSFSETASANVSKNYSGGKLRSLCKSMEIKKSGPKLLKFGEKCVEISWMMLVCDPPMAIGGCKKGEPFSGERFKPYTRSEGGIKIPVVEMPVWPALHLHEGGPLVAKGVAQPGEGGAQPTRK